MITWMYFPKNRPIDPITKQVVNAFNCVSDDIDSHVHQYRSDEVLAIVRPGLEAIGFTVEKSNQNEDLVSVPVLYGLDGHVEESFEVDGYLPKSGYVTEIEAGRGTLNNQFLKDFIEACAMIGVKKLCIAVRNTYKTSHDFDRVYRFFNAIYASRRLRIPLSGLLLIGY